MTFQAHGITHVGRVRTDNQDRILMLPALGCFAVWDGMGGQRAGDVAAETGLTVFGSYIESSHDPSEVTWPFGYNVNFSLGANRLITSIRLANRQVSTRSDQDLKLAGMGTTVAAVLSEGDRVTIANVGDSRVYRLRGGVLEQLSVDDTMAALMVSKGVITPESVPAHPMRGVLMQAVGLHGEVDPHVREEAAQSGDLILICSDGLYGAVDAAAITAALQRTATVAERTQDLIDRALSAGASDNVSVILIEFTP
ncbi:MAG: protein phosphatase 2C domain-containing protein [Bryobacteraceae bacterium]|jgi:protein phosphatase